MSAPYAQTVLIRHATVRYDLDGSGRTTSNRDQKFHFCEEQYPHSGNALAFYQKLYLYYYFVRLPANVKPYFRILNLSS